MSGISYKTTIVARDQHVRHHILLFEFLLIDSTQFVYFARNIFQACRGVLQLILGPRLKECLNQPVWPFFK